MFEYTSAQQHLEYPWICLAHHGAGPQKLTQQMPKVQYTVDITGRIAMVPDDDE